MGVRGLTTYITNKWDTFHKKFKLRNCRLVVDGNSLVAQLYNNISHTNCAFGGDYAKFSQCVHNFFSNLKECGVQPFVILDGGYETTKLKTVIARLKQKIRSASWVRPENGKKHFPLLLKEVFKKVLGELQVPIAQCLFEADREIAALARHLNCPVLSCDSDFYIFNVLYIPFPGVDHMNVYTDDMPNGKYMMCSIFNREAFFEKTELSNDILPFLAVLLGNDLIARSVFRNFLSHLKRRKGKNEVQRNISALIEWIKYENLESAMKKTIDTLPRVCRQEISDNICCIIKSYQTFKTDLLQFLGLSETLTLGSDTGLHNTPRVRLNDLHLHEEEKYEDLMSERENERVCYETYWLKMPNWFLCNFQKGILPGILMDMMSLNLYILPAQIEDYDFPCSHFISLPIIGVIYGLLFQTDVMKHKDLCCIFRRNIHSYKKVMVKPIMVVEDIDLPSVENIPGLSHISRRMIMRCVVGIEYRALLNVPEDWQLFFLTVAFWARNARSPVLDRSHILAVVVLYLCAYVLNMKLGYSLSGRSLKKCTEVRMQKCQALKKCVPLCASAEQFDNSDKEVTELDRACSALLLSDCEKLYRIICPLQVVNSKLKLKPKSFSLTIVHTFAQFQSCFMHLKYLNSLLKDPFINCSPAHVFSGTFAYNLYSNLQRRGDPMMFLEETFGQIPAFLNLIKDFTKSVFSVCVLDSTSGNFNHKRKYRKYKRQEKMSEDEAAYLLDKFAMLEMSN